MVKVSPRLYIPRFSCVNEKAHPSSKQKLFLKSKQVREQELNSGYETADESWNMKLERQAMTFTTIGFDWQIIESY